MSHHRKKHAHSHKRSQSGVYTVFFAAIMIPLVVLIAGVLLNAAMSHYEQSRLRFVGNEVIAQFESPADLNEKRLGDLFINLAHANGLMIDKNIKIVISDKVITSAPGSGQQEPGIEINFRGTFHNGHFGLAPFAQGFNQSFIVKDSQFTTHGYLAINGYPYCQLDPSQNLCTYLPIFRPSPGAPTWHFQQDTAIGGVRKAMGINQEGDELKPENWKQLADNLVSIY